MSGRILFLTSVMMAGCVVDDVVDPNEENLGEVEQALKGGCPEWECGMNSPIILAHKFYEFSKNKAVTNEQGFRLVKFIKGTTEYNLSVERGKLLGYNKTYPWIVSLSGSNLIGSQMWFKNDATNEEVAIKVTDVRMNDFMAKFPFDTYVPIYGIYQPGPPRFESYKLDWIETKYIINGTTSTAWQDLCEDDTSDGIPGEHSVLLEGDRYDRWAKIIKEVSLTNITIGCNGGTVAKMMLTGHAYAAKDYGFATTVLERQAMLKMLTGTYCPVVDGVALSYTVPHMPLYWADEDKNNWLNLPSNSFYSLEARFNAYGATCLNTPRIVANPTSASIHFFGTDASVITCKSSLPTCTGNASYFPPGIHLNSANPVQLVDPNVFNL